MKKFKFPLLAFMTALISFGFTACSDDDDLKDVSVTGITITPTTLTLKTGTTGTLTATVVPRKCCCNNCRLEQFGHECRYSRKWCRNSSFRRFDYNPGKNERRWIHCHL